MKIRNQYRQKIQSESGASLAAALLFFIVCAVVGSIIIAAAMSSAGRMSGITSADNQRYALESARSLIEDTMMSDPEDENSYYTNENVIGQEYQAGYVLTGQCTTLREMELTMAETMYQAYWNASAIQDSWPKEDPAVGNPDAAASERTDTEKTSSWVPERNASSVSAQQKLLTLTLENTVDEKIPSPAVKADFKMDTDFSILVNLSCVSETEEGGKNKTSLTDSFVLYPTIQMDYESVLPEENEEIGVGTASNVRKIYCKIGWENEGTENGTEN